MWKSKKLTIKHTWKCKQPRETQTFFKKNEVGKLKLPDWKSYYKAKELGQGCASTYKLMEQNRISEMDSKTIG